MKIKEIESVLVKTEMLKEGCCHTPTEFVHMMVNEHWSQDKCFTAFCNLQQNPRCEAWAELIIEDLEKVKAYEDLSFPEQATEDNEFSRAASISSIEQGSEKIIFNEGFDKVNLLPECIKMMNDPMEITRPQPAIKQSIEPIIRWADRNNALSKKKKASVMYTCLDDGTFELKKVLQVYQESLVQVTENVAVVGQLLCAAVLEIFQDSCTERIRNKLSKLISKLRDMIDELTLDPSLVKPTIRSLLGLMCKFREIVDELKKPTRLIEKLWNYKANVKMYSLLIKVFERLIRLVDEVEKNASSGDFMKNTYKAQQNDLQEALDFYNKLPNKLKWGSVLAGAATAVAAIGIGYFFGVPAAVIVAGVGIVATLALYGGKIYLVRSIESCKAESQNVYDETLGIKPLFDNLKILSSKAD